MNRDDLEALDATDPLARFRDLFTLPKGVIYLDGNSLGALPRATAPRVAEVIAQEWGHGLIRSWNDAGWIDMAARVADKIARVIGAPPGTVAVGDSTSVNLFKLLAAALRLRPGRRVILSERANFPTDLYVAEGLAALLAQGHELRLVDAVPPAFDPDVAVVMLTHVNYRTGGMHDMAAVTRAAHEAGALMLWDLAHSAGAVPLDLAAADADFAVGCGYKYLNGGPGAPAFLHVAERLHATARFPITGWLGHADPFAFEPAYRPAPGIAATVVGTPSILALAALEVGLDIGLQVPMHAIRAKSQRQTEIFAALVAEQCPGMGFTLVSPPERGSQISFAHEHAHAIMQALIARDIIGDFRAPDILRFGFTPLYVGFAELWDAVRTLREVMLSRAWDTERFRARQKVT